MTNLDPYRPPAVDVDTAPTAGEAVAQCPKCGGQSATKVSYNWWGGALGPKLFHVVKCRACKAQYNGRTGAKLTKVIIAYQVIVLVVMIGGWLAYRNL